MDIKQAMEMVEAGWPFDAENYKSLAKAAGGYERQAFALTHINLHTQKTLGKLASQLEAYQHDGAPVDEEIVREVAIKLVIAGMRLALANFDQAERIEEGIAALYAKRSRRP